MDTNDRHFFKKQSRYLFGELRKQTEKQGATGNTYPVVGSSVILQ
jgi:hypothetical protein